MRRVTNIVVLILFVGAVLAIILGESGPESETASVGDPIKASPLEPVLLAPNGRAPNDAPPGGALNEGPDSAPAAEESGRQVMTGLVVGRDTGRPIADALVLLVEVQGELIERRRGVRSDSEGMFSVPASTSATHVFVLSNGYMPAFEELSQLGDDPRIVLERGAVIAGRVVGPDGLGIKGVSVLAVTEGGRGSWPFSRDWLQAGPVATGSRSETDAEGNFQLVGLEHGRKYRVDARRPGWRVHHELGPVRVVMADAPAEGIELQISPLAGISVEAVDAGTGKTISAELSARGGLARGLRSSHVSVEDAVLSGYHVTDLATAKRFSAYYIPSPSTHVEGQKRDTVTVKAYSLGYQPASMDVPLEWGVVRKSVVRLVKKEGVPWAPVTFTAYLPNGSGYEGKLVFRLRRGRERNVHLAADFKNGISESISLPEGEYTASPGGLGSSCRWWPAAGPVFSFKLSAEAESPATVRIELKGTPLHLRVRTASGAELIDFSVGVRAERAARPYFDDEWSLSMLEEGLWTPGRDRVLWLSPGKFEVTIRVGVKVVGKKGIEVDGSGTPLLLNVVASP